MPNSRILRHCQRCKQPIPEQRYTQTSKDNPRFCSDSCSIQAFMERHRKQQAKESLLANPVQNTLFTS